MLMTAARFNGTAKLLKHSQLEVQTVSQSAIRQPEFSAVTDTRLVTRLAESGELLISRDQEHKVKMYQWKADMQLTIGGLQWRLYIFCSISFSSKSYFSSCTREIYHELTNDTTINLNMAYIFNLTIILHLWN
jgi:hypothetical protein